MAEITKHKQEICMCSLFLLYFQQEACTSRSGGRWKDEGSLWTSSLRPAVDPERKLWQNEWWSLSQLASTYDSHVQVAGHNNPSCPKVPLPEAWSAPCPISNHPKCPSSDQKLPGRRSHSCGVSLKDYPHVLFTASSGPQSSPCRPRLGPQIIYTQLCLQWSCL